MAYVGPGLGSVLESTRFEVYVEYRGIEGGEESMEFMTG